VAHIKLSHSRAFLLRAYLLQTHEMLFDAHRHAFRVFGGVPGRGIYDNMRTAVDRVGKGKERQVNARFLAMTSHYVFEPEFWRLQVQALPSAPPSSWGPLAQRISIGSTTIVLLRTRSAPHGRHHRTFSKKVHEKARRGRRCGGLYGKCVREEMYRIRRRSIGRR